MKQDSEQDKVAMRVQTETGSVTVMVPRTSKGGIARPVLVCCGGRANGWLTRKPSQQLVTAALGVLRPSIVMHGGAYGADEILGRLAKGSGVPVMTVPAMWEQHGRCAGPRRNALMLEVAKLAARDVRAFVMGLMVNGGAGTEDMQKRLQKSGCQVINIQTGKVFPGNMWTT